MRPASAPGPSTLPPASAPAPALEPTPQPEPEHRQGTLAVYRHQYDNARRPSPEFLRTPTVCYPGGLCLNHNSTSPSEHRAPSRSSTHPALPSRTLPSAFCMVMLLWLAALASPAAAVLIPFENCLGEARLYSKPTLLQWVPLFVDASFDTADPKHTLRVTMWGNVTGSTTNVTLPPIDSPDWTDPNKTDGKIVNEPEPDVPDPKLTTLHSKVGVLSYDSWSRNTNFCDDSLENATCPLGPFFGTDPSLLPHALPAVTMSNDFYSSYAFASFSATFLIIYGDTKGTNIGCMSATVTPDLGGLSWMLKFLPLLVLLFVGAATVFAGIFSPWGTADIFHWTSNYGRDADLLRLVTPGFGDCLQYIQFVVLTGSLTLSYPGFYQPIVSQGSWSVLMFNQSFVSGASPWQSVQDGIYVTNGTYGLHKLAQLVGMAQSEDIWASMMVWLLGIIGGMFVLVQAGFLVQWLYRFINKIPEEDLRAKNIPFTLGNVVRIVLNYFLLPIVALSTFQLVIAGQSPAYTVALAVLTLIFIIGFATWLLYLIATTKPRAFLFDDLPTLLLYGPLYNTYSDEAAAFTLIPVLLSFVRGIAIGAVQPAGVAQVVLLAICEVIQILTLHAFRPFHSPTSMNAYHTLFSAIRLVTVLLMVAFIPSLGVTEGPKGWFGYAILLTHAGVLILGFLLNAVQTIVEVLARMFGAGGDDIRGQTRGGLGKIFGMRQLSRRMSRRDPGPSRQSQMSSSGMLDAEDAAKPGYVMPGGRLRSESAGSMGGFVHRRQRSSSALDTLNLDAPGRQFDSGGSSFTPTTPGEASAFSFLPSPGHPSRQQTLLAMQTPDPYYRPPRQRRQTLDTASSSPAKPGDSWAGGDWPSKRMSQMGASSLSDPLEMDGHSMRETAPSSYTYSGLPFAPRTDYATREVDFYYGIRGERLNSDAPNRKLGTGPADPTGPMASAAGWVRGMFGGKAKAKDKGKGFEVVRSARMPPAMRPGGSRFGDDAAPQGIPVAMGVLRNGPIDSDDEDDVQRRKLNKPAQATSAEQGLLSGRTNPSDVEAGRLMSATNQDGESERPPDVPRKSSKRDSSHFNDPPTGEPLEALGATASQQANLAPFSTATSRLPFERTPSQQRLSSSSAGATEEFSQVDLRTSSEERPAGFGFVHQGSVGRVDPDIDLLGRSAEVVDDKGLAR